ncbi:putative quinol monooxygenase [Asaia krungthepensis]|uniref:Antibiotic biosynthesis monooxygenase n=1 Tax=Asaia krungthepensis NRIC 0535 TaxID=1307925 RepID=A0ABQ0PWG0_9PROT|nr:putative quinol monooxygenase [Asaia krungthepensis]GBQ83274.1 putative antibiotic biosynthesis monooxygenase [Asaia krungthepensis NRIC 0535]
MSKVLYATMRALPGKREEIARLLTALADDVRSEPGNERFVVYTLEEDPDFFHVEETYRDEEAFKTHIGMEHGKVFNNAIKTLVEGGGSKVVFLTHIA